jgi:hypothetical protein
MHEVDIREFARRAVQARRIRTTAKSRFTDLSVFKTLRKLADLTRGIVRGRV